MGFSDWVSVVSVIVAAISLGVSVSAAWFSKAQADAAKEANRISLASLDVSKEQLAVERRAADRTAEPPYVPPWRLSWVKGDMYALTNGGSHIEHDVHVEPPEHSAVATETCFDRIEPKSSVTFMLVLTSASPNRNVTVTWLHPGEQERRSWSGVLPSRS